MRESHSILRNFNDETPSLFADDIITPVYVAPTRSPTTFRPKHHKENIQERPSCDDEEDCEEGSGEPVTTEEIFVTSTTGPFYLIFNSLVIDFFLSFFYLSLSLSFSFLFLFYSFFSISCFQNTWFKLPNETHYHTISIDLPRMVSSRSLSSMYYYLHTPDEVFPRHLCVRFSIDFYWPSMHRKFVRWPLWSGGSRFWGGMVLAFRSNGGLWKYYWKSVCLLSCWKEFVVNISSKNSYIYIVSGIFSSHDFVVGSKYSLSFFAIVISILLIFYSFFTSFPELEYYR